MFAARKFSRFTAVLTLALSVAGASWAQGGSEAAPAAAAEAPVIKVVTTWDPGFIIDSNSPIWVEWGKRTGVKFDVTMNPRDNHKEKVNILLASRDIPDMLRFFQDASSFIDYGPALFEPLDSYMAAGKLPNLKKYMDKYPEIGVRMKHPKDGLLYAFPLVQDFDYFSNLWYVRNDILKSKGLDAANVKSLDDLKKVMLALKDAKGGDFITSTRLGFSYYSFTIANYFGLPSFGLMFDGADPKGSKKYVIGAQAYKDKVRTFIEFENWMIQQKLLHPNFLTMKDQELFAGYADGSFPLMREQFTMPYTPISSMNPKADPKIEIKPIYPFPVNGVLNTIPKSVHYNIAYRSPWVIGKNSKVKEAVVKAQNYMYSDEGRDLSYLGIEGETFVRDPKTPSGYRLTNVQSVWTRQADGKYPDGMKTLKDMGFASWWTTGVVPAYERFALLNYKEGESDKAFTTSNEAKYMNDNGILRSPDPDLVFTREESQAIAELSTSLNTYIEEGISKFVLGTKPMAEFDDFIKGLEKFETKKLLDIYNGKLK